MFTVFPTLGAPLRVLVGFRSLLCILENSLTYRNQNMSTVHRLILKEVYWVILTLSISCVFKRRSRRDVCANTLSANGYRRFQLPLPLGYQRQTLISQNSAFCSWRPFTSILNMEHCRATFSNIWIFLWNFFQIRKFWLISAGVPRLRRPLRGR